MVEGVEALDGALKRREEPDVLAPRLAALRSQLEGMGALLADLGGPG